MTNISNQNSKRREPREHVKSKLPLLLTAIPSKAILMVSSLTSLANNWLSNKKERNDDQIRQEFQAGFILGSHQKKASGRTFFHIQAAVPKEKLFDIFCESILQISRYDQDEDQTAVKVLLETSHNLPDGECTQLERKCIYTSVLLSKLSGYRDLLVNDQDTGIYVLAPKRHPEVQLTRLKFLNRIGGNVEEFRDLLEKNEIVMNPKMQIGCRYPRENSTNDDYADQFQSLAKELGIADELLS